MIDGGPAFPTQQRYSQYLPNDGDVVFKDGMSLRDWFAGMALIGVMQTNSGAFPVGSAEIAYEHADAMLKERAK